MCALYEKVCKHVHCMLLSGRIPHKIAANMSKLSANEWKNFVTIFALDALRPYLRSRPAELKLLRKLRSICVLVCQDYSTEDFVGELEAEILSYCKGFETLYGKDSVVPNMHMVTLLF